MLILFSIVQDLFCQEYMEVLGIYQRIATINNKKLPFNEFMKIKSIFQSKSITFPQSLVKGK